MLHNILFLPHGMQIIPGVEDETLQGFEDLDQHMHDLLDSFASQQRPPSSEVILLTPHGYNLQEELVLYNHESFHGYIFKLNEESNVIGDPIEKIELPSNSDVIQEVLSLSDDVDLEIKELIHGYPAYPLMLNWGEVVPLYYYSHYFTDHKFTILCYPRSRHTDLDHIRDINTKLVDILDRTDRNTTLIVSGDLSHTHLEDGPYGYHEVSKSFDDLINKWAENGDADSMVEILKMQPDALACGMSGLDLIHLLRIKYQFELKKSFYEVPTYFGMGGYWWYR